MSSDERCPGEQGEMPGLCFIQKRDMTHWASRFAKLKRKNGTGTTRGGGSLEDEKGRDRINRYIDRKMGGEEDILFCLSGAS